MQLKHLQFSAAFAIIFIVEILMQTDNKTAMLVLGNYHYAVKPMITISLMIYLFYHTQLKGRFSKRVFTGLLFGLFGDSLLMFVDVNDMFFLYGLIAFLIGHIAYISAFFIDYTWAVGIEKRASLIAIVVLTVFSLGFYLLLRRNLGDIGIPVLIYMIVISIMAIMAVNRKGRVNTLSFNLIFWGAVCFVISDAVLAYNRFMKPFQGADVLVIAVYMLAQFFITLGAIERKLKKHSVITKGS